MSDQDIPTSGSRWEPADGAARDTTPQPLGTPAQPPTVEAAAAEHGAVPNGGSAPTEGTRLPGRRRKRSALAAAGVGLVLAGGLGGFAIGHAVAGTDGAGSGITTDADQNGIPDGPRDGAGPGGARGFDHDGDGQDGPRPAPDQSAPDGSDSSTGDDGGTA